MSIGGREEAAAGTQGRRRTGSTDGVGCGAIGKERFGVGGDQGPAREGAVGVGQAGQLEQAGFAGGAGQNPDPHITGEVDMAGEPSGIFSAHEEGLPKGDMAGGKHDHRLPGGVVSLLAPEADRSAPRDGRGRLAGADGT